MITFSVVIPTYNRAQVILRAVQSVLKQSWRDFELIIVDDGSTDNTSELLNALSSKQVVTVRQENSGVSAARNLGVRYASGDYVIFLDSDDEVLPDWLNELASLTVSHDVAIVSCAAHVIDSFRVAPTESLIPRKQGPSTWNLYGQFLAGTYLVRRDIFEAVGGYAEILKQDENTELSMRLGKYCHDHGLRSVGTNKQLVIYHRNRNFDANDKALFRNLVASNEYILTHHWEALQREPHRIRNSCVIAGVNCMRLGRYTEARSYFREAIRYDPRNWRNYVRMATTLVPLLGRAYWLRGQGLRQ